MKRRALELAALAGALGAAGFLFAWLGLVPVAASSGHWAITSWFLHFTMRQSVQTRSLGIEVPPLDDPALVLRGAGHFDDGCAPCHGAPGMPPSKVAQEMTPHPPELPGRIPQWEPEELFWIVKHGVKFTGMPAWVARKRDDEVWAMVAFLLRLPDMTPDEYRALARGEVPGNPDGARVSLHRPLDRVLSTCARCHGRDGAGRGQGAFPRLAGRSEAYLYAALRAYADAARFSGIMQPQASGLSEEMLRELARHFAGQEGAERTRPEPVDRAAFARGEDIAKRGVPQRGIPSCIHCHGPSGMPRNPYYPVLAGQYADYLVLQLELFRKGIRGGSPFSPIMNAAAHRLERQQMQDVAAYYAGLGE